MLTATVATRASAGQRGQRRRWARFLMDRGRPWPRYGTPEWCALADGDPRKVAACVAAAECWARDGDELVERLRWEVEDSRRAFKAAEDAEYRERAAAHREEWKHLDGWVHPANRVRGDAA